MGDPDFPGAKGKRCPVQKLAPLPDIADVAWVSLQKGKAASQANEFRRDGRQMADWTNELHDFSDTAALIAALDLVITIDTAIAHLAGALGKPVWILLPYSADWRWM